MISGQAGSGGSPPREPLIYSRFPRHKDVRLIFGQDGQ
jgi:hypothetical protein